MTPRRPRPAHAHPGPPHPGRPHPGSRHAVIPAVVLAALAAVIAGLRHGDTALGLGLVTADFRVYVTAARVLWNGGDIYAPIAGVFPYIYPPLAAILASPFLLVPWPVAQVIWLAVQGVLVLVVLRRLGLTTMLAGTAAILLILLADPFRTHMGLGQVGVLLMTLIVCDMVAPAGRRRWIPAGVGVGIATGIKLTPVLFIIHLWLVGRRREAYTALGTFVGTVALEFAVTPGHAWGYWSRLAMGDAGANTDARGWLYNISVVSASIRFWDLGPGTRIGLVLSVVLVLITLAAAALADRRGHAVLAIALVGLVSSLANPISWSHHLVFVAPLLLSALPGLGLPRVGPPGVGPRVALPGALRWLIVGVAAWLCAQPQAAIGGAPGSMEEIHSYTVWEKTIAAMPDILMVVLAVSVLCWGLAAGRAAPTSAARTEPRESDVP